MYLADYHVHSACSPDCSFSMEEMAAAAVEHGVDEICFTDHVDMVRWGGGPAAEKYDWDALTAAYDRVQAVWGDRLKIRLGAELGEMAADFALAERYLDAAPPLDFIIGSLHLMSPRFQRLDFVHVAQVGEQWDQIVTDYLEELLHHVAWGRFSVVGHLTLPLRYAVERSGMDVSFQGHMDEVEQVLRAVVERGLGIECNTNRGHTPLPDREILTMYRRLGGEIITLGSDAHRDYQVGKAVAQCQELLRQCGFDYFCTYEKMKPIFHKL